MHRSNEKSKNNNNSSNYQVFGLRPQTKNWPTSANSLYNLKIQWQISWKKCRRFAWVQLLSSPRRKISWCSIPMFRAECDSTRLCRRPSCACLVLFNEAIPAGWKMVYRQSCLLQLWRVVVPLRVHVGTVRCLRDEDGCCVWRDVLRKRDTLLFGKCINLPYQLILLF